MEDETLGLDAWIESIEREIWERSAHRYTHDLYQPHNAATDERKAEMEFGIYTRVALTTNAVPARTGIVVDFDPQSGAYLIEWGSPSNGVPARIWTTGVMRLSE